MVFKKLLDKIWGTSKDTSYDIEFLPSADDITFNRESKKHLQRFDEYITIAETEAETLSIELDNCLEQKHSLEIQLKNLNKSGSWHERHLLLKLDRLQLHCDNLKQRIEIYSQNIIVYLNLISKLQDIKAMRMEGLDAAKMENIWLDFKETLDKYKDKIMTEESSTDSESVTTKNLEDRLEKLRDSILPTEKVLPSKIELSIENEIRPPIEKIENREESKKLVLE